MKKCLFLVLLSMSLLISGCATTGPMKGAAASDEIYTDASRQVAFDTSLEALQKLGYKIEMKDQEKFCLIGSYWNLLTGYYPLYARIDIIQEASETKILYGVDQAGTIKELDITSYYPRCANNIYNEISKTLIQKGHKARRSR